MNLSKMQIEERSVEISKNGDAESRTQILKGDMEDALDELMAPHGFMGQGGRDECWVEDGRPLIQVSYDHRFSQKYSTELVFTLRDNHFVCYVRTWEFKSPHNDQDYSLANNGDLDEDAEGDTIEEIVSNAKRMAVNHHIAILEAAGVTISPTTREKMYEQSVDSLTV